MKKTVEIHRLTPFASSVVRWVMVLAIFVCAVEARTNETLLKEIQASREGQSFTSSSLLD